MLSTRRPLVRRHGGVRVGPAWLTATALLMWLPLGGSVASAQIPQGPAGVAGGGLPGGASSLQETHGDWGVACANQEGKKVCAFSQRQTNKDTRQLVLAVELTAPTADRAEGTLVLPFGLALERPIALQIDEAAAGAALRVRTCVPVGCLVSLAFDPLILPRLRKGTMLTVKATADGGQETAFQISLKGFSEALDRTAALAK